MKRSMLVLCPVLAALAPSAAAQIPTAVESTFETGTDGWTHVGAALFQQQPSGGNPAGRLYIDNSEGPVTYILAPGAFLGDRSGFKNGTFRFDGRMVGSGGSPWMTPLDYGHVWISGGGSTMSAELAPALPSEAQWETHTMPLTAAHWGVTQFTFETVLANVTEIKISVEALFGAEIQAIDNVRLEPPVLAAACTTFNGTGVNPVEFACVTTPAVGTSWQSTIAKPPGTLVTVVLVATQVGVSPAPNPFGLGELLVGIVGSFEQFANGNHAFQIPNNPALVGLTIDTQGFRVMPGFVVPALNGIRLTIGI